MSSLRSTTRAVRGTLLAAVTALGLALVLLPAPGVRLAATDTSALRSDVPTSAPIRIVQANIKSRMATAETKADIARAYAQKPDFITFNEVTYRPDSWLVRDGYAMWRTPGNFTGETPVVWNTARWNMVAQGTWLISNKRRVQPSNEFERGIRYANWVSLQSNLGERISVVSTHFAPRSGYTVDLIEPSLKRLGQLVKTLRAHGPVLVGGDLNVNYKSRTDYPRSLMASLDMAPVYDVTGTALSTGDYRGSTIDYVLLSSVSQFAVDRAWVQELNSDHRLLGADVKLTGTSAAAFTPGTVRSNPTTSPRAIAFLVIKSINLAPEGAVVHLASRRLDLPGIEQAIIKARQRGVHVQLLTSGLRMSAVEKRLVKLLGTRVRAKSWVAHQRAWFENGLPAASSMVSASGGIRALRIDANRALTRESYTRVTRATVTIDKPSYDRLFVPFLRAAGRSL
jgi:endonuclease/exonuclease/phosphatase family metal-dependent hydrolase